VALMKKLLTSFGYAKKKKIICGFDEKTLDEFWVGKKK